VRRLALAAAVLLAACADARSPVPGPAAGSELCGLVAPHGFAEATIEFLRAHAAEAGVAADRRWIADVLKTRRCLCGADKTGCPE
jgi:hypothetical protein